MALKPRLTMKVLFTLLMMFFCLTVVKAETEFKYKNMYYITTSDSTAKLSRGYLIGDIVIPDTVINEGKKYAVTEIYSGFNVTSNPQITSVVIPATVKIIRTQAFSGQTEITDLYFLGGNITFESSVFSQSNLIMRKVHINNIEEWCNNKYSKDDVIGSAGGSNPLNNSYIYINGEALKELHLSSDVTTISANAFEGVQNQFDLICDSGLISIESSAFLNSNIQNIELPSTLKNIEKNAFRNCPIKNLTIPENVISVGSYAFENNKQFHKIIWKAKSLHCQQNMPGYAIFSITSGQLDTLIIDTGVEILPEYMFYSTIVAVKPIIISKSKVVPFIYNRTFYAVNKNSALYVPYGTRNEYLAWGFKNIYEMEAPSEDEITIVKQELEDLITTARTFYEEYPELASTEYMQTLLSCIEAAQAVLANPNIQLGQLYLIKEGLSLALKQAKEKVILLGFDDYSRKADLYRKVLINNQIYIITTSHIFTPQGKMVK